MKKSKLACLRHDFEPDPRAKKNVVEDKILISYTPLVNKINGTTEQKRPPKPKSEKELFDDIIEKNQGIKKVRKFFHIYVERQNAIEEAQSEFKDYLNTELN